LRKSAHTLRRLAGRFLAHKAGRGLRHLVLSIFYEPFWQFSTTLAPLAFLIPVYLTWADRRFRADEMVVFLDRELNAFKASVHDSLPLELHGGPSFCGVGYTAMMRPFVNQLRSVESIVGGWVVALICRMPFYSVIGIRAFRRHRARPKT
jgi:hypothetical protein